MGRRADKKRFDGLEGLWNLEHYYRYSPLAPQPTAKELQSARRTGEPPASGKS